MTKQVKKLVSSQIEVPVTATVYNQPPGPWAALLKHLGLASFCFVAICALTVCVILFYPRQYHSVTKLLLRDGRENVTLDPTTSTAGETLQVQHTRESEILTAIEMMASREILQGVIDKLGTKSILDGALPDSEATKKPDNFIVTAIHSLLATVSNIDPIGVEETALIEMENSLQISAPDEAGVVTIEYRAKTPQLAQSVTQEWIELFRDHYLASTRTSGAYEFFVQQDGVIKKEMAAARLKLSTAKNKFGIITISGQQQNIEQQIQTIELNLLSVDADLAETKARVLSLTSQAEKTDDTRITQNVTGLPNPARDNMRTLYYEIEVEKNRLSAMYTEDHPLVQAANIQLASAIEAVENENKNRKEITLGLNPIRQIIDEQLALSTSNVQALAHRAEALTAQKDRLQVDLTALNKYEQVITTLNRKIEILDERFRSHSLRFEQARLDIAMYEQRISSVNVVQSPSLEFRPVTPRKSICAILGLFAALATSLGLPMWIETLRFAKQQATPVAALLPSPSDPLLSDPLLTSNVETNVKKTSVTS